MGQSTDAILAFGVDLGGYEDGYIDGVPWAEDEYDEDEASGPSFWEWYCKKLGIQDKSWSEQNEEIEKCPIEIVEHCSGEYVMELLVVRGTVTKASRGYPLEIKDFDVPEIDLGAAIEFCQEYSIPFENPKWLLASMWW